MSGPFFREVAAFEVFHGKRAWPWIAFAARAPLLAFAESDTTVATRILDTERVMPGVSFAIDLELAAFTISSDVQDPLLAVAGRAEGAMTIAVLDAGGERRRVRLDAVLEAEHELRAIAFDRTGRRLWLSVEGPTETIVVLLDAETLRAVGVARSAAFPRPALHELHVHTKDDAVLLLAACGEDGTFARVVGFAGDEVSAVPGALDSGGIAAGFVGFSSDGMRVFLVEADELRTHAWPSLLDLASVPLPDDIVSSFSGAVLGDDIFVDGDDADADAGEDAVVLFDRSAIRGIVLAPPAPTGMWAGRLGPSALVTVAAEGDPAQARILVRTKAVARPLLG